MRKIFLFIIVSAFPGFVSGAESRACPNEALPDDQYEALAECQSAGAASGGEAQRLPRYNHDDDSSTGNYNRYVCEIGKWKLIPRRAIGGCHDSSNRRGISDASLSQFLSRIKEVYAYYKRVLSQEKRTCSLDSFIYLGKAARIVEENLKRVNEICAQVEYEKYKDPDADIYFCDETGNIRTVVDELEDCIRKPSEAVDILKIKI